MGVAPAYHRRGIGRALFQALRAYARDRGYAFLQVKTVEEGRYAAYDRTAAQRGEIGLANPISLCYYSYSLCFFPWRRLFFRLHRDNLYIL